MLNYRIFKGHELVFKATLYLPLGFVIFVNLCAQTLIKIVSNTATDFMQNINESWSKTTELDKFYEQFMNEIADDVYDLERYVSGIIFFLICARSILYFLYLDINVQVLVIPR